MNNLGVIARLRAHELVLETLLSNEIRKAAHVALADPEAFALRLAERWGEAIQRADQTKLAGPDWPISDVDRTAMLAAIKREIDWVVSETLLRIKAGDQSGNLGG